MYFFYFATYILEQRGFELRCNIFRRRDSVVQGVTVLYDRSLLGYGKQKTWPSAQAETDELTHSQLYFFRSQEIVFAYLFQACIFHETIQMWNIFGGSVVLMCGVMISLEDRITPLFGKYKKLTDGDDNLTELMVMENECNDSCNSSMCNYV